MYRVAREPDRHYSVTHYTRVFDVESPTSETIVRDHKTEYGAENSAIVRAVRLALEQDGSCVYVDTLTDRLAITVSIVPRP